MFYNQYLELCSQKGISPSKAALENGISKTSVTRWKKGAVPNAAILKKLTSYFGVSIDCLLGTDQKNKPSSEEESLSDLDKDFLNKIRKLNPQYLKVADSQIDALLALQERQDK